MAQVSSRLVVLAFGFALAAGCGKQGSHPEAADRILFPTNVPSSIVMKDVTAHSLGLTLGIPDNFNIMNDTNLLFVAAPPSRQPHRVVLPLRIQRFPVAEKPSNEYPKRMVGLPQTNTVNGFKIESYEEATQAGFLAVHSSEVSMGDEEVLVVSMATYMGDTNLTLGVFAKILANIVVTGKQ